jgi:beta-1,4-mannosyl-glycoprotein beta-1,4-N-acetylglucosaminyltransferase
MLLVKYTAMIIDCFPFYNELEVLELRLEELKDVVDWFVLVEAGETYSGQPKVFVYEANRSRFEPYNICHVKVESFPPTLTSPWAREEYARNALAEGLRSLNVAPTDVVLLSDVDEIPRADLVASYAERVARGDLPCCVFNQSLSYYYVNCLTTQAWLGTRMIRVQELSTFHALRACPGMVIPEGGWHFSYLGGVGRIQQKIQASIHTELNRPQFTDPVHIEKCLAEGIDLFGREMRFHCVPLGPSFPCYLCANPERFQHLIHPGPYIPRATWLYERAAATPSDINEHLPYLRRLASTVEHVTEFGTRHGLSTSAFLDARPQKLITYDRERQDAVSLLEAAAQELGVDFAFHQADVLEVEIAPTDLLFIDTWHVEEQMREELRRHADRARRYLALHDTETFAYRGEAESERGIWYAVAEFMRHSPHWRLHQHFAHNNGLTVFTRVE